MESTGIVDQKAGTSCGFEDKLNVLMGLEDELRVQGPGFRVLEG